VLAGLDLGELEADGAEAVGEVRQRSGQEVESRGGGVGAVAIPWSGGACAPVMAAEVAGTVAMGRPLESMRPRQSDTKVVGARVLPGLGRRL
jgi:hypothetical protein